MKYAFTLAAIAALAAAQSISDLPSCSLQCVASGVSGVGCELTDFKCSCEKADQLTPQVTPCVQEACTDAADQEKVITALEGICASAGVPITIPKPGASSSAAPEEPASTPASSAAPTVQTSVPTPSATDIVISDSSAYPEPTSAPEESCVVTTITVTETIGKPTVPAPSSPPYPTGPAGSAPAPSAPSGTGVYTPPPEFTGAASAVKVPAGIAGILGLAAFVL